MEIQRQILVSHCMGGITPGLPPVGSVGLRGVWHAPNAPFSSSHIHVHPRDRCFQGTFVISNGGRSHIVAENVDAFCEAVQIRMMTWGKGSRGIPISTEVMGQDY